MNVSSKMLPLALVVAAAINFQFTQGSSVIDTCAVTAKIINSNSDSGGSDCGKHSASVDSFFTCKLTQKSFTVYKINQRNYGVMCVHY